MGYRNKDGINFLLDDEIARRIVSAVDTKGKDVLEVGGGLGQLTRFIRDYRTLTVIEKQAEFALRLKEMFPDANVIQGDALRVQWPRFQVFISNTPYSISTPLLEKLWKSEFEVAVVTLQKEVADRITSHPGTKEYSRLTVMINMKFQVERMFDIPPSKFSPRPEVYSTVLRLRRNSYELKEGIEELVRMLFSHRRKKIKWLVRSDRFGEKRPEDLSTDDFEELFEEFNAMQRS